MTKRDVGRGARGSAELVAFVVSFVTLAALPLVASAAFPDLGGFTRQLLFVRPTPERAGYLAVVDRLQSPGSTTLWFHSRGQLSTDPAGRWAAWTQGDLTFNLTFVQGDGGAPAVAAGADYAYSHSAKELVPHVAVTPGPGASFLVTVARVTNASEPAGGDLPLEFDVHPSGLVVRVNGSDALVVPAVASGWGGGGEVAASWEMAGFRSDAALLFHRSGVASDRYLLALDATRVSGSASAGLALPRPSRPSTFVATASGWSYGELPAGRTTVGDWRWEPPGEGVPAVLDAHPGLYFSGGDLSSLRAKVNGTTPGPWQAWYDSLGSGMLARAFRGLVEEDDALLDSCVPDLLSVEETYAEYERGHIQDISRSTFLVDYLVTYDLLHQHLTDEQRESARAQLRGLVAHLVEGHEWNVIPLNNHLLVTATAIGLGGLVLGEPDWVAEAQRSVEFYLGDDRGIRPGGACYEGASYADYAFRNVAKFFYALAKAGGPDYFSHPKYQAWLNWTVDSAAPTGHAPAFEDCAVNQTLGTPVFYSVASVNRSNPVLAGRLRWYLDLVGFPSATDVHGFLLYDADVAPSPPPWSPGGGGGSFVSPDDGYAIFRGDWGQSSWYVALSNKDYLQSHVHEDENSLEVYAGGVKWLTNPGYPGWGAPGHDYATSARASNTATIDGRGQLRIWGDGFSAGLTSSLVDFVASPTVSTYGSPFNPRVWPGFLVAWAFSLATLAGASFLKLRVGRWGSVARAGLGEDDARDAGGGEGGRFGVLHQDPAAVARTLEGRRGTRVCAGAFVVQAALLSGELLALFLPLLTRLERTAKHVKVEYELRAAVVPLFPAVKVVVVLATVAACVFAVLVRGWADARRNAPAAVKVPERWPRAWLAGNWFRACGTALAALLVVNFAWRVLLVGVFDRSMVDGGSMVLVAAIFAEGFTGLVIALVVAFAVALPAKALHARFAASVAGGGEARARVVAGALGAHLASRGWWTLAALLACTALFPPFFSLGFETLAI